MDPRTGMTGIKDVDLKILMEMDDRELLAVCSSPNKYFARICQNDLFWQQRYMKRFASIKREAADHKPVNQTWKQYYLQAVIDLDRFSNNPWKFLPHVLWSPRGSEFSKYRDNQGNIVPFEQAPGWVMNNFFLLNLGPVTVNNIFYPSITPFQLFELVVKFVPDGTMLSGMGLYRNKDLYSRNN